MKRVEIMLSCFTGRVSNDYLAHLQSAQVSYLFCGYRELDLQVALRKLAAAFKLRKLMLQVGGHRLLRRAALFRDVNNF
ncbi:MAG TPA: hypothetical protein VGY56_03575 [Verrucomicrobiae bacterium]|nr:hypothetical protein [Verrucomicrobiae bacterium]